MSNLTPRQIVEKLDRYIVGQHEAKRAVAIALRNRWRRRHLESEIADEIYPKNIIMIGPTGVGKTEIARRLARLVDAPFLKVEATKFTEVGYVGRDVESMIRDLVEIAIRMVKNEKMKTVAAQARRAAYRRILDKLAPYPRAGRKKNPLEALLSESDEDEEERSPEVEERRREVVNRRRKLERDLEQGLLDDEVVEIEVEDRSPKMLEIMSGGGVEDMGINLQDLFGGMLPRRTKKRRVTIKEALRILEQEEAQKLIDMEEVATLAVERTEQSGIIFLDELDKIAGRDSRGGPDVSREGVQRDILPIVEGSTVMTKYGPVRTDYILFIAAGAFHVAKPSDLIPELQGRFPIRVELKNLSIKDFKRILTEPQNAVTRQYVSLLETEGLRVSFSPDGIDELAQIACEVNDRTENIGARRLHTIVEKVLEDISFDAPSMKNQSIIIDRNFVDSKLQDLVKDRDLARYIL